MSYFTLRVTLTRSGSNLVTKLGIPDIGAGERPEMSKIAFSRWKCQVLLLKKRCINIALSGLSYVHVSKFLQNGAKISDYIVALVPIFFLRD